MHWAYHRENNTYYNGISHIYIYVNIQHCPAMCDIRVCVKMRMPEIHGHLLKKMMIMGIEGTPCSDKAISNGEVPRIHTCYGCFSNNHQVLLPFRSFTFVDSGPMHNFLDASLIFMGHDLALPHSLLNGSYVHRLLNVQPAYLHALSN